MTTIILLALLGAVVASVVGTVWYSPATPMGRLHMKAIGFDKLTPEEQKQKMEDMKPYMAKMYAGQMILSLLTSFAVVFIVTMGLQNGLTFGMALGFVAMNWLCFMVPLIGSGIIWGNGDTGIAWKRFFSDISSNLLIVVIIALLTSFFV